MMCTKLRRKLRSRKHHKSPSSQMPQWMLYCWAFIVLGPATKNARINMQTRFNTFIVLASTSSKISAKGTISKTYLKKHDCGCMHVSHRVQCDLQMFTPSAAVERCQPSCRMEGGVGFHRQLNQTATPRYVNPGYVLRHLVLRKSSSLRQLLILMLSWASNGVGSTVLYSHDFLSTLDIAGYMGHSNLMSWSPHVCCQSRDKK